MRRIFLFSAIFIFGQTLFAQINLDSIWQKQVVERYKQMDNYTMQVVTNSSIRGKWIVDNFIDTTYNKTDSILLYMEWKNGKAVFRGIENNGSLSYTQNDTNITIENYRGDKYIAINPLSNQYGEYLDNVSFDFPAQFVRSIIDRGKNFKKIDGIYDDGNYFVFECVDSIININDIQMYEDVKMYVNKDNYLLEKITTKRQNNTLAELGLGEIEREIIIKYLEINQENSLYKTLFNPKYFPDYIIIRNKFIWETDARQKRYEKFEKSKQTLNNKLLDCQIVDFENNTIKLNDIKGWLLFDTWNASCFPCFGMMKEVALNQREFEKRGVTIVALNTYEKPTDYLKAFCEKQKVNISELYFFKNKSDITIFQNQLKIFPSIFLISPDKKVVWQTWGKKSVKELLQEIDKFIKK